MGIYASAATNKAQPLNLDYVDAAQQVNQYCGPNFVNGTIPGVGSSGTAEGGASGLIPRCKNGMVISAVVMGTFMVLGW